MYYPKMFRWHGLCVPFMIFERCIFAVISKLIGNRKLCQDSWTCRVLQSIRFGFYRRHAHAFSMGSVTLCVSVCVCMSNFNAQFACVQVNHELMIMRSIYWQSHVNCSFHIHVVIHRNKHFVLFTHELSTSWTVNHNGIDFRTIFFSLSHK